MEYQKGKVTYQQMLGADPEVLEVRERINRLNEKLKKNTAYLEYLEEIFNNLPSIEKKIINWAFFENEEDNSMRTDDMGRLFGIPPPEVRDIIERYLKTARSYKGDKKIEKILKQVDDYNNWLVEYTKKHSKAKS